MVVDIILITVTVNGYLNAQFTLFTNYFFLSSAKGKQSANKMYTIGNDESVFI